MEHVSPNPRLALYICFPIWTEQGLKTQWATRPTNNNATTIVRQRTTTKQNGRCKPSLLHIATLSLHKCLRSMIVSLSLTPKWRIQTLIAMPDTNTQHDTQTNNQLAKNKTGRQASKRTNKAHYGHQDRPSMGAPSCFMRFFQFGIGEPVKVAHAGRGAFPKQTHDAYGKWGWRGEKGKCEWGEVRRTEVQSIVQA